MSYVGGSIESVTLRGRIFNVAADNEVQRKLGGFENEFQSNGDGSVRQIMTRVPFSITGLNVAIDDQRGDQEYLQMLSDTPGQYPITITFASGITYGATGNIVGELQVSSQNTTATINLSGQRELKKQ